MHELDLIRAASEDVDSARMLLQKRTEALDAIVQRALDHEAPMDKMAEAGEAARAANGHITGCPCSWPDRRQGWPSRHCLSGKQPSGTLPFRVSAVGAVPRCGRHRRG